MALSGTRGRKKYNNREGIIKRIHKSNTTLDKNTSFGKSAGSIFFPGDLQLRRNKWRQISLLELQPKVHAHFVLALFIRRHWGESGASIKIISLWCFLKPSAKNFFI
jgi:hypothetical protein